MTPSFMIGAPASGSGKTLMTCGLLQMFKDLGYHPISFKCGPDYIDPMFHSQVLQIASRNLDTFFTDQKQTRQLFLDGARGYDVAVLEGVMGYYDGLGGCSIKASAHEVAKATGTKTLLLVDCKGASVSILPLIQGFLQYQKDSRICGVLLNRISPMMYPRMKTMIEEQLPVKVYGYIPVLKDCVLESRHLGLVMPNELDEIQQKLKILSDTLQKTLEVERLLQDFHIEKSQYNTSQNQKKPEEKSKEIDKEISTTRTPQNTLRVAFAKDQAFCFFYEENLEVMKELGVEPVFFSPMDDQKLPENIAGLVLYGGYPELHASKLSQNVTLRQQILDQLKEGLPCIAECGGFLYLQKHLEDMEGQLHDMVGYFPGTGYKTDRLSRFGYVTLEQGKAFGQEVGSVPAHEFHYYDVEDAGNGFVAKKPVGNRSWPCMVSTEHLLAGFPHLYYRGNEKVAAAFVKKCREYFK